MASNNKLVWAGRVISALVGAGLLMSAAMKLRGGEELAQQVAPIGLPASMIFPLGILELVCAVIYLFPPTAVLGAVLVAGYMGGAICTHWRVGDPFVIQIGFGVLAWLGVYLRDERLRALIPVRRNRSVGGNERI